MRWFAFASALIVGSMLSGCTQSAEESLQPTAKGLYPIAKERALAWAEDAALTVVFAVEAPDPAAAHSVQVQAMAHRQPAPDQRDEIVQVYDALRAEGDTKPGDGVAPAWAYQFISSQGPRIVVVGQHGAVLLDKDRVVPGAPAALGPEGIEPFWTLDSDEAASLIRADADFLDVAATPGANGQMQLSSEDGVVAWSFVVNAPSRVMSALIKIRADTGETLSKELPGLWEEPHLTTAPVPSEPGPGSGPARETGVLSGILGDPFLDAEASHDFAVGPGHSRVAFLLEAVDVSGPVSLRAHFERPTGGTFQMSVSGTTVQDTLVDGYVADGDAGLWHVRVVLGNGFDLEYRLSWCTDGAADGTQDDQACMLLSAE